MRVDDLLRGLLFQRFRVGAVSFDFLEGLLAVCITGAAYLLRTPFEEIGRASCRDRVSAVV